MSENSERSKAHVRLECDNEELMRRVRPHHAIAAKVGSRYGGVNNYVINSQSRTREEAEAIFDEVTQKWDSAKTMDRFVEFCILYLNDGEPYYMFPATLDVNDSRSINH